MGEQKNYNVKLYIVWFRKKGQSTYPKWLCEDPTFNKEDADDQVKQAKAIGCETRVSCIPVSPPVPGAATSPC